MTWTAGRFCGWPCYKKFIEKEKTQFSPFHLQDGDVKRYPL
jgi:hypothetical protein